MRADLKVQTSRAGLVVPVVPDLDASKGEDLVVVGPGGGGDVDQLQGVVKC